MRTLKCTNCNANLTIQDDNRDFAFCEFCGTKIMLDDYRSTHRIVDEAKIKQAEVEREIKLKELELIEKKQIAKKRRTKIKIIVTICVLLFAAIFILVGKISNKDMEGSIIPIALMIIIFVWIIGSGDSN